MSTQLQNSTEPTPATSGDKVRQRASAGFALIAIGAIVFLASDASTLMTGATLDPATRRLLKVEIDDQLETDRVISDLMGRDPAPRFEFIMERAEEAHEIDV